MQSSVQFAGFAYPKRLPMLKPIKRNGRKAFKVSTAYYRQEPAPVARNNGASFYLDSDFMPGLRWQWCDDVLPSIRHTGWFADVLGEGDKIRGLVFRLPHGRGFLAGWSMGEGMSSSLGCAVIDDEHEAARMADRLAEIAAEAERDHEAENDNDDDGEG